MNYVKKGKIKELSKKKGNIELQIDINFFQNEININ